MNSISELKWPACLNSREINSHGLVQPAFTLVAKPWKVLDLFSALCLSIWIFEMSWSMWTHSILRICSWAKQCVLTIAGSSCNVALSLTEGGLPVHSYTYGGGLMVVFMCSLPTVIDYISWHNLLTLMGCNLNGFKINGYTMTHSSEGCWMCKKWNSQRVSGRVHADVSFHLRSESHSCYNLIATCDG